MLRTVSDTRGMRSVKPGKGMTIKAQNLACICVRCKTGGVCSEQRYVKEWCSHNVRMKNVTMHDGLWQVLVDTKR